VSFSLNILQMFYFFLSKTSGILLDFNRSRVDHSALSWSATHSFTIMFGLHMTARCLGLSLLTLLSDISRITAYIAAKFGESAPMVQHNSFDVQNDPPAHTTILVFGTTSYSTKLSNGTYNRSSLLSNFFGDGSNGSNGY